MQEKFVNGEHKGIRIVTRVDKHGASMIKRFLEAGVQVRHVDNLPPVVIAVFDEGIVAKVHKVEREIIDGSKDGHNSGTGIYWCPQQR